MVPNSCTERLRKSTGPYVPSADSSTSNAVSAGPTSALVRSSSAIAAPAALIVASDEKRLPL